jgi:hypothetical protein
MNEYLEGWRAFFDHYAQISDEWHRRNAGYHQSIAHLMKHYVPDGSRAWKLAVRRAIFWPPCVPRWELA